MAIEHATVQVVRKPWGVADLHPWSDIDGSNDPVGELWFQRSDRSATIPALLLKLLFTSEPLSIQVHPDDAFAHTIGLPNGKTEAWYILSATPDAGIGLSHGRLSLSHLVRTQTVRAPVTVRCAGQARRYFSRLDATSPPFHIASPISIG